MERFKLYCENYSVLMSVYIKENPEYLDNSINSIFSQTVPTDDFVLVCDGDLTKELYDVIDKYKAKYQSIFNVIKLPENLGLGRALNFGMEHCKNDIIARMDSDDIAIEDRCEKQLELFAKNPELDIVSGTVLEFENNTDNILSKKSLPQSNEEIHSYSHSRCPFNHPAVMYKKSAVLEAGGYLDFPLFEDYYLWVRMLKNGAVAYNIQQPILYMRAGSDMYKRRGGISYLKKAAKFRNYMLKSGYCSFGGYIKALGAQAIICLMPVKIRIFLYNKLLRGSEKQQ